MYIATYQLKIKSNYILSYNIYVHVDALRTEYLFCLHLETLFYTKVSMCSNEKRCICGIWEYTQENTKFSH